MNLAVIDIIFFLLITLFVIRCYLKGFIGELLSMAAIILGILSSLIFFKKGGEYLRETFWPEIKIIPEIAAFIALFIIVFLLVKLIEIMLKGIISGVNLGGADRFLGILFGFVEGTAVICIILYVLKIQPLFDPSDLLADSIFAKYIMPFFNGREGAADV